MLNRSPEHRRFLRLGHSSEQIELFQMPFELAVNQLAAVQRESGVWFYDTNFDDFLVPPPLKFGIESIASDERIQQVVLTHKGYMVDIKDAEYVMYRGIARMNTSLHGINLERGERFALMQSYLDHRTFRAEMDKYPESSTKKKQLDRKSNRNNRTA